MMTWTTALVVAVVFVATLIRSAFGFGEALVAVPLLAFLVPVDVAAPVAVLVSITVSGVVVARDWQDIDLGSAGRLVISTFFGIPIGLLVLTRVADQIVQACLSVVIIAFAAYRLATQSKEVLNDDRVGWAFGFGAGVLGGAYGMNGPPLVVYGTLRGWSPARFRATLQGYFLPASLIGMGGYWLAGLWTPAVTRYYLVCLPAIVAAILLGRMINRHLSGRSFLVYVYVGLVIMGVVLLGQSL